ncbi:MAG: winged helix-turn-helix domain-containing protein [Gammaproteobacteria bacterium]|nr:winged helix-turn-helix domain-containing protein [Gammaproteobacteria bacterium]MBT8436211.1 winged helix-turn-helix domain-containing protein [Gammaproteobacteria bacterium]
MTREPISGRETYSEPFFIGEFEVNPATHSVSRNGLSLKLEPRAMELLLYLAHRPGIVVSREELEQEVWKGLVVGYDALNNTVAKLRKAFDDDPKDSRVIHTVPKKGYQLIAEIRVSPPSVDFDQVANTKSEPHPSLERKLAAILYADVADYSRLTGLDEEGTHRSLSSCLDLMSQLIERFHGNVVHFAGDAILAEFATVSNALGCAVTMQQDLAVHNADFADDRKLQFRIGVNLGEVIVDRNDIYGDGVNVAARLEDLAEPGGICLSGSVFDSIGNQLPLEYSFLGERQVKNIEKPVRAYQARLKPGVTLAPPQAKSAAARRPISSNQFRMLASVAVLVVILGAALLWIQPFDERVGETDGALSMSPDGKPSIAVLPFENISDDPAQEYYADGMTGDLITDLSKLSGLTVIARHSMFAYKDQPAKLAQIAQELHASHVVEGSVRRFEGRIRVNVSLIDATTSTSIWSERYDGDESELFDLHNRVVGNIVSTLAVELSDEEQQRMVQPPTNSLEAYDYYLRAERRRLSRREKDEWITDILQAMQLYRKAIELDPEFAEAYVGLALIGLWVWGEDETDIMPGAVAKKLAYDSASKVSQLDPQNPAAYRVLASLQATDGQHEISLQSSHRAIELDPNNAAAWATHAKILIFAGQHEAALDAIDTALALNPRPPDYFYGWLGKLQYLMGRYDEAASSLDKVHWFRPTRLMNYGQLGRLEEAKALRLRMASISNLGWYRARFAHYKRKQDREHMIDGLRKAGVPEHAYGFEGNAEDRLDSNTLEELAMDKAWSGADSSGTPFTQQFSRDGRIAFKNKSTLMVGAFRIKQDMLCVNFPSNILGRDDCGNVYRNQGGSRNRQNEYVWAATGAIYYFSVDE